MSEWIDWGTELPARLYVVAEYPENGDDKNIWTISPDPEQSGWDTDSSHPRYGLPKRVAEEIVRRYNADQWTSPNGERQ